jgi:hypothetical protein
VYDRIWWPENLNDSVSISNETNIDIQGSDNPCHLPVEVLRTAVQPRNGLNSLSYNYTLGYSTPKFLVYFHFAEIIAPGNLREFNITLNGLKYGPFKLEYLKPLTIGPNILQVQEDQVRFSIDATLRSDLPPILNAFEIFELRPLPYSPTNQTDGMFSISILLNAIIIVINELLDYWIEGFLRFDPSSLLGNSRTQTHMNLSGSATCLFHGATGLY